jgi:general secretion pathway protein A
VLLLGLSHDRCRILLESERELPLQVLTENWFGKGYVLWKDFEELGTQLTVGSVGLNVQRLHRLLVQTQDGNGSGLSSSGSETVFSRQTEASVARFQRTKRLTPDGVVGPLTMILLYNAVPTYTHPRLG